MPITKEYRKSSLILPERCRDSDNLIIPALDKRMPDMPKSSFAYSYAAYMCELRGGGGVKRIAGEGYG